MISAKGILRHRFHGSYSAVIGLMFDSAENAKMALSHLSGWEIGKDNRALIWIGDSEALEECKKVLASFGADAKKIDSIAKSIDFGEPFTCEFPYPANIDQMSLF